MNTLKFLSLRGPETVSEYSFAIIATTCLQFFWINLPKCLKVTRSEQQSHESGAWEELHAEGTAAFVTLLLTVLQEHHHLLETHASFH